MTNKVKTILLIDDDDADNFLHKRAVESSGLVESIVVQESGQDALDYLSTPVGGEFPAPTLIFLDINMPGMNGWEFLEAYEKLPDEQRAQVVLVMLTTSRNPAERERAEAHAFVDGFRNKPLTAEMLVEIVAEFLSE